MTRVLNTFEQEESADFEILTVVGFVGLEEVGRKYIEQLVEVSWSNAGYHHGIVRIYVYAILYGHQS